LARAFHVQPVWKRFIIIVAGPLMNLVFPVFIYFVVFSMQSEVVPAVVGMLLPDGAAKKAGLAPGDAILEIDGEEVRCFDDLREVVGPLAGKTVKVVFMRDGRKMEKMVEVEKSVEYLPLDIKKEVGRLGIYSSHRVPIIQVPDRGSPAYGAGLRTGDQVLKVGDKPIVRWSDLSRLSFPRDKAIDVQLLRQVEVETALGPIYIYKPTALSIGPRAGTAAADAGGSAGVRALGIESTELYVGNVTGGSAADMIGISSGDRVVSLNGREVRLWDELETTLKTYPESVHRIKLVRPDGSYLSARFKLKKESSFDQLRQPKIYYVFGASNYVVDELEDLIPNPNPITRAIKGSIDQTVSVVTLTLLGLVKMFQGKLSFKTLGGPIMIFDIAGKAAKKGAGDFMWIMALISINLGIINLFPIPMLDGGLVVLLLVEIVMRRTPSPRFRLIYQYIGLAMIGLLIVFVFKNDIERYWDSITGFFKNLL
ncbi:MAG: site-2 protease family protein, partial [Pseudomonadota bacterium]